MSEETNINGAIIALFNEINSLRAEISELKLMIQENKVVAQDESTDKNESLDLKISKLLYNYKIHAHLKGYHYLREAIKMVVANGSTCGITREIYPAIARMMRTTSNRVERAIRHAIEISHSKSGLLDFEKPTNSEFIAMMVEQLRFEQDVAS